MRYLVVLFVVIGADRALACCETYHQFVLQHVRENDVLNIRELPHHKAKIVGKLSPKKKVQLSILESVADLPVCVTQPTLNHQINAPFKPPIDPGKNEVFLKPFKATLADAPVTKALPKGSWCRVDSPEGTGWVNAHYLKYVCSHDQGDLGGMSVCKPISK